MNINQKLQVVYLDHYQQSWPKLAYAKEYDAGFDLRAAIENPMTILPNNRIFVPTGVKFGIPINYEIQVRSRSGLAYKNGLFVLNSPGTIDCGYTGEVLVILFNTSQTDYIVNPGDKIAQAILSPYTTAIFETVQELHTTQRGESGFGSSGK